MQTSLRMCVDADGFRFREDVAEFQRYNTIRSNVRGRRHFGSSAVTWFGFWLHYVLEHLHLDKSEYSHDLSPEQHRALSEVRAKTDAVFLKGDRRFRKEMSGVDDNDLFGRQLLSTHCQLWGTQVSYVAGSEQKCGKPKALTWMILDHGAGLTAGTTFGTGGPVAYAPPALHSAAPPWGSVGSPFGRAGRNQIAFYRAASNHSSRPSVDTCTGSQAQSFSVFHIRQGLFQNQTNVTCPAIVFRISRMIMFRRRTLPTKHP